MGVGGWGCWGVSAHHAMASLSLAARSSSVMPGCAGATTPRDHSWKRGSYLVRVRVRVRVSLTLTLFLP